MTSGGRQRQDGSSKRVQLTSGDHGGPKDKKSKGRRKTSLPGGKASRAASLREVERFRESIRAAEQRRTARENSPKTAPPAGTEQHTQAKEHPVDTGTALKAHLTACIQAVDNHDWVLLRDSARQLAEAADYFSAQARSDDGTHR
ncbi:hypothetical protein [Streptomyces longwoodensis]|uniref:hypothetical protein n=1 Tax=Streptomyces longwoodensis TaxID=68231 RepID=UPI00340A1CA7